MGFFDKLKKGLTRTREAFTDKISADLEAIDNKVNDGENREKIIGDYVSDAAFEEWYNSFAETLNTACGK